MVKPVGEILKEAILEVAKQHGVLVQSLEVEYVELKKIGGSVITISDINLTASTVKRGEIL